jgi:NAD(P)-dependent dehydrogenase (short-subunit alcohol dehydrogenase family)
VDEAGLHETVEAIGQRAVAVTADVSDDALVRAYTDDTVERWGPARRLTAIVRSIRSSGASWKTVGRVQQRRRQPAFLSIYAATKAAVDDAFEGSARRPGSSPSPVLTIEPPPLSSMCGIAARGAILMLSRSTTPNRGSAATACAPAGWTRP